MGPLAIIGILVGIIGGLVAIGIGVDQLLTWIREGTALDEILDEVHRDHPDRVLRDVRDRGGHSLREYTIFPRRAQDRNNCYVVEERPFDSWVLIRVEDGQRLRSRPLTRTELIELLRDQRLHTLLMQHAREATEQRYA
jgi:hypothetical protein